MYFPGGAFGLLWYKQRCLDVIYMVPGCVSGQPEALRAARGCTKDIPLEITVVTFSSQGVRKPLELTLDRRVTVVVLSFVLSCSIQRQRTAIFREQ